MSARLDAVFARTRKEGRPAIIAYLCIGDPDVAASLVIARALLEAGADALELGAPFSDPTADGPVIARASTRAIAAGGSLRATLEVGRVLRQTSEAPLILFGYANPIVVRGERTVVAEAANAGIDAMLVVDLPPEEGEDLRSAAREHAVDVIPLLTPTSAPSRVEAARKVASGFVYYVSMTGITGSVAAHDPFDAAASAAERLRAELKLPVVIGFGIDDAAKAKRAYGGGRADGIVVGSAIVKAVESADKNVTAAAERAAAVIRAIRG